MDINVATLDYDDRALEALLSDELFNEFDPMFWISDAMGFEKVFAERVFPVLAEHHSEKASDELTKKYSWLTNLSIPSKRHESAQMFQKNPIRNLTILDVFVKLQFVETWGAAMMQSDPSCCIYSELFRIISAARQNTVAESQSQYTSSLRNESGKEEDVMLQDFKEKWMDFKRQ